jgi:hypothetical protein
MDAPRFSPHLWALIVPLALVALAWLVSPYGLALLVAVVRRLF